MNFEAINKKKQQDKRIPTKPLNNLSQEQGMPH